MLTFDPSQQLAFGLDPTRHARILGAPGTGKTTLIAALFGELLGRDGWGEEDVLVLAPSRLVSASLRARVERAAGRAIGGTPVRTAASLAFSVLARSSALAGREAPRLLTGTVQDEAIAAVVEEFLASGAGSPAGLSPEILMSQAFRAELRELWRVCDDFGREPAELAAELASLGPGSAERDRHGGGPAPELAERWLAGLRLIEVVAARIARERPVELSSSALLRRASETVLAEGAVGEAAALRLPRTVLVDDAQELGEGELALLAACARVGSAIWVFGDPDTATAAFHGERTRVLAGVTTELDRKAPGSARAAGSAGDEQALVLATVHRHGEEIRGFVSALSARIGSAGVGAQRAAKVGVGAEPAARAAADAAPDPVQFAVASSSAEQIGMIAHRLRARRLGLGGETPVEWSEMAVICRSRGEAARIARLLAGHQVPSGVAAGGIVLREHQIVSELIALLRHALGIAPLDADGVLRLLGGVVGGLDPVAVRRLRGALLLQERREARAEARETAPIDAVIAEAFAFPGAEAVIDSPGGRALRRVGIVASEGLKVHGAGGTARETLWAIWDRTGLASRWQDEALAGRGSRADEANRSLDAVLGLFFALQRHEEQDSEQPIAELLDELLTSTVPEDTLAQRGGGSAVTVTTPQGTIGREFGIVAITGLQDGGWPNLRARGSLLGTAALERWLQGGEALPPSRRDTLHDELRLLVQSASRARSELLAVAVADDDEHPSSFFGLGREFRREGLPSARLTLRGATAAARRELVGAGGQGSTGEHGGAETAETAATAQALAALVALAAEGVPGAAPDDWYGVRPPSTVAPLVDLDGDPEATVSVSPSQLETAEDCPLNWAISSLGGGTGSVQASLGTLVHHALETAEDADPERLLAAVMAEWEKLPFEAEWESERARRLAESMTRGLAAYLREFEASDRTLVGREAAFRIPIERAVLRGVADRLESRRMADGREEVTVLDLKTGKTPPSMPKVEAHAQLQAYQLGVLMGAFSPPEGPDGQEEPGGAEDAQRAEPAVSGGARLLYVHPGATKKAEFFELGQAPISDEARDGLIARVAEIARVMAAGEFTARVEHHCSDSHQPGSCRLHIIEAVSHA
ncbi:PD-(D/E)XK nuclease family protein [Leucobacter luti]|uniref:PD-(D/E)XK nuclease family protein n=1 Tax=Leucobacter luti TaxID=340320 RepID=UPI003D094B86